MDMDVESLASLKCLLIGAGTLGCNVARCLMVMNLSLLCIGMGNSKDQFYGQWKSQSQ